MVDSNLPASRCLLSHCPFFSFLFLSKGPKGRFQSELAARSRLLQTGELCCASSVVCLFVNQTVRPLLAPSRFTSPPPARLPPLCLTSSPSRIGHSIPSPRRSTHTSEATLPKRHRSFPQNRSVRHAENDGDDDDDSQVDELAKQNRCHATATRFRPLGLLGLARPSPSPPLLTCSLLRNSRSSSGEVGVRVMACFRNGTRGDDKRRDQTGREEAAAAESTKNYKNDKQKGAEAQDDDKTLALPARPPARCICLGLATCS
ncbi:uncharacterized protein J3D65DRAFT_397941 [Phyllosticta citribraziliensis]|uniref:Uncharacterized protein n=1 Tax=Phyllosticta citribraziliensis TaxID=989973 RepID=A0ABR1LLA3_9PEZI